MDVQKLRKEMIMVVNTLSDFKRTRELACVITKTEEAMMWCGSSMRFFTNSPSSYKNDGKRHNIKDIEKRFDDTKDKMLTSNSYVQNIDAMREFFGKRYDSIAAFILDMKEASLDHPEEIRENSYILFHLEQIAIKLKESRMWLGMELGRIKREHEKE